MNRWCVPHCGQTFYHPTPLHCQTSSRRSLGLEAAAKGGCFLIESAVPAVCHWRQHNFDQFFIGNGIVAAGLISTADTDGRNQNLTIVERMDIQAAVPIHLLFIVRGVTVIIVAFGNAVAVAQEFHDGAVAWCPCSSISPSFWHGNGADDGFGLRAEDCLTAACLCESARKAYSDDLNSSAFNIAAAAPLSDKCHSYFPERMLILPLFSMLQ